MTTPEALLELADRVEREEPSWRLTCEIEAAVTGATLRDDCVRQGIPIFLEDDTRPLGRRQWRPPSYTTSLDSAVTLVPEGYWYTANTMKRGYGTAFVGPYDDPMGLKQKERAEAKTPAAALTAASLRARAADMQARAEDGAPHPSRTA